jgi:hypothetical protein
MTAAEHGPSARRRRRKVDTSPEGVERRRESQSGPGAPGDTDTPAPPDPKKNMPHEPEPDSPNPPPESPLGDEPAETDERVHVPIESTATST